MKLAKFANSVDPDKAALNEPPHLELHCFPCSLSVLQYDITWPNIFLKFCSFNFVVCFFLFFF